MNKFSTRVTFSLNNSFPYPWLWDTYCTKIRSRKLTPNKIHKRLVLTTAFNDANGKRDCKEDDHDCPSHFVQKIEIYERSSPEILFNTRPNMTARQQSLCYCTYKGEDLRVQPWSHRMWQDNYETPQCSRAKGRMPEGINYTQGEGKLQRVACRNEEPSHVWSAGFYSKMHCAGSFNKSSLQNICCLQVQHLVTTRVTFI